MEWWCGCGGTVRYGDVVRYGSVVRYDSVCCVAAVPGRRRGTSKQELGR